MEMQKSEIVFGILSDTEGVWENIEGGDDTATETARLNMETFTIRYPNCPFFPRPIPTADQIVTEGSKTTGFVIIEPFTLVQHLMDTVISLQSIIYNFTYPALISLY